MTTASGGNETATHIAIRRAALDLFLEQGFEATSLRQIAERAGMSRAALYEHFRTKEDIVRSVAAKQEHDLAELTQWANLQKKSLSLPEQAVLRWLDSMSPDGLQEIRFATLYPAALSDSGPLSLRALRSLAAVLLDVPGRSDTQLLLMVMAFQSVAAAVLAARESRITDAEVLAAARTMARALARAAATTNDKENADTAGANG